MPIGGFPILKKTSNWSKISVISESNISLAVADPGLPRGGINARVVALTYYLA